MPPKKDSKTVAGAYTAHIEVHIDPDDNAVETLLGEAAAVGANQHTDGTQQAQLSGDPVADQLATMSASFATLVAMFQETREEVAELKAQLAASKEPVVRPKTFINPSIPGLGSYAFATSARPGCRTKPCHTP
jgi:hypothetical protein